MIYSVRCFNNFCNAFFTYFPNRKEVVWAYKGIDVRARSVPQSLIRSLFGVKFNASRGSKIRFINVTTFPLRMAINEKAEYLGEMIVS
jgi:hypothetical protein